MKKILILGQNGALGKAIKDILNDNPNVKLLFAVRNKEHSSKNFIYWNFRDKIPSQFKDVDVVINCARSDDFNFNVNFNKILISSLPKSIKIILFSSNAIYAKPNGLFIKWLFKGDAYIREKKIIEKFSFKFKNVLILRPTIVRDEGSWNSFVNSCNNASDVVGPLEGNSSRIKLTNRKAVAELVEKSIFNNLDLPDEIFNSIESVDDFIGRKISYIGKKTNFFQNYSKNFLLTLLSSRIFNDTSVFFLQKTLLGKNKKINQSNSNKTLMIEGMTKLYLFGGHTKKGE